MDLRPGEEKKINLNIQSKTNVNTEIVILSNKSISENVKLNINPNHLSILPLGNSSSSLSVHSAENTIPQTYIVPFSVKMSLPSLTKLTGSGQSYNFINPVYTTINKNYYLTITLLPKLSFDEWLNDIIKKWISPISGLWTFLAGVGTVIAPLIIRMYSKKRKNLRIMFLIILD